MTDYKALAKQTIRDIKNKHIAEQKKSNREFLCYLSDKVTKIERGNR